MPPSFSLQDAKELVKSCIEPYQGPLSSGVDSLGWRCDLLQGSHYFKQLMNLLKPQYMACGIELGGLMLAKAWSPAAGFVRKDGQVYLPWVYDDQVTLMDDVVTTGMSFTRAEAALQQWRVNVAERVAVLDRRPLDARVTKIRSLFRAEELDLPV